MPELFEEGLLPGSVPVVYAVVADVERYPEFLPGVRRVRRNGDLIEMTIQAGPLELTWVHRAEFIPNQAINLTLVRGPFRRLDGGWTFEPSGNQTFATYTTSWELDLPIPGAGFIVAAALKSNIQQTMRAFRQRVRQIVAAQAEPVSEPKAE